MTARCPARHPFPGAALFHSCLSHPICWHMYKIFIALSLALTTALPALADPIPLSSLTNYIRGLSSAQTTFTQISADGAVSTGKLYLRRPGRARFEYDNDGGLVIAGGSQVAVFDPVSNQPPEQFPLKRTPLNLILSRSINLANSENIISHSGDSELTSILAHDPKAPELGTLEMVFTGDPIELRQWIMTDETGGETTVVLGPLESVDTLPNSMFNITREIEARQR